MQALGMVETQGLIGAIEAADTMLKAANVQIVNKHYSKGGIVTVEITGDVGAVKAAVDAGTETTKTLGSYLSSHVIPRPAESIEQLLNKKEKEIVVNNENIEKLKIEENLDVVKDAVEEINIKQKKK